MPETATIPQAPVAAPVEPPPVVPAPATPPVEPVTPPVEPVVPPVEAPPVIPAGAIEIKLDASGKPDLSALSPTEQHQALFGTDEQKARFVIVPPAAVTPVTPPVVPPVAVVPPVVPPVTPVDPDAVDLPSNVRFSQLDPQLSAYLIALKTARAVNPKVNPVDVAIAHGYELPPEMPAAVTPPAAPVVPVADPIAAAEAELAALDAQLVEASKKEGFLNEDYNALQRQARDKATAIEGMKLRAEMQQQTTAQVAEAQKARIATSRGESRTEALKEFPTAGDDASELGLEMNRLLAEVNGNPQHPLAAELAKLDGPQRFVREAAKLATARLQTRFGLSSEAALAMVKGAPKPAEAPSPAPVPVVPPKPPGLPPVPRTVLVTAPGGPSAPDAPVMTAAEVIAAARNDPKLRQQILFGSSNGVTVA